MDKKTIFITGAASGIGRETALLFARNGWYVGMADAHVHGLETLVSQIGRDGCYAHVMDVTDCHAYQQAIDRFVAHTDGRFDALFNNAGIVQMGQNESISLERQHRMVDININGVLNGIHLALPYLKRNHGAHIVTMCSASGLYGMPELAVYSATKHAVRALTEALDIELEHYGIIVTDIIAPYVNTGMITGADRVAYSVTSTGVNVQPEQVAATVWRAVHGNKLHWKIHHKTHLLSGLFWLFPFAKRAIVKRLFLTKTA